MPAIRYTLTDDDLQMLYPLCRLEDICALFPENAPKEWTIRRRYRALGLAPINSEYKYRRQSIEATKPVEVSSEEWSEHIDLAYAAVLEDVVQRIWQKIRTVEARSNA